MLFRDLSKSTLLGHCSETLPDPQLFWPWRSGIGIEQGQPRHAFGCLPHHLKGNDSAQRQPSQSKAFWCSSQYRTRHFSQRISVSQVPNADIGDLGEVRELMTP